MKEWKPKIRELSGEYGVVFILIVLYAVVAILNPNALKLNNIINLVRQMSAVGILSLGIMTIIISGGIDLSLGNVIGLTSVVCALSAQQGNSSLVVAIILPILVGATCGAISGFFITITHIPPFITTLGMTNIAYGVSLMLTGGHSIANVRDEIIFAGRGYILGIPTQTIIFAICILIMSLVLGYTKFGKKVYAVGGNVNAANVCGIKVNQVKMIVYIMGGVFAAIAGIVMTGRVTSGNAINGEGYHLDAIAASVIGGTGMSGGTGKVAGTVVGVLIIGVIQNGMDLVGVSPYTQRFIKGCIIILAVLVDSYRKRKIQSA